MGQSSSSSSSSQSQPPPPPSSATVPISASITTRPTSPQTRRSSLWRRSFAASTALSDPDPDYDHDEQHTTNRRRSTRPRPMASRSASINRLSQLLHSSNNNNNNNNSTNEVDNHSNNSLQPSSNTSFQRSSRLQRARTSLNNFGSRHSPFSHPDSPDPSRSEGSLDFGLPNVSVPDLELNFDHLLSNPDPVPQTPSSRSSFRLPASLSDRISNFRSDRSARNLIMSTRRAEQSRSPLSENAPGLSPSWPWSSTSALDTPPRSASTSASGTSAQSGGSTRTETETGTGVGTGAGVGIGIGVGTGTGTGTGVGTGVGTGTGTGAGTGTGGGSEEGGQPRAGGEDNTALLSRLLSVAAAATAATLLDGNQQAIADARSVAGDGDDGTFSSFLQSLESGRLASALRQGGQTSAPGSTNTPLNFFRMFRFGTSTTPNREDNSSSDTNTSGRGTSGNNEPSASSSSTAASDGRMVPIIIVGIRSVNPTASNNVQDTAMPPFLDALSALPTTLFGGDSDSIDNILRPAHRFSHRRRASMGGINNLTSAYDAQRHHASPDRDSARSHPIAPNTAAPTLSRVSSANSASAIRPASRPPSSRSNSNYSDRRESIIRTTTTTTTLETTAEDAPLRPRTARPRRLSESDHGRRGYSSRRNGIVEPDNAPTENTRSWIIYVLGGSYPENHPILTTPSLFTDSPTYEDMMLLSALLGPAKPPVASEQDVADAPGIFKVQLTGQNLAAVSLDGEETTPLTHEQRCLVCLCDFEPDEEARRLVKCGHLFHKECIDQWLTKGCNSCPLCRGQGVDEKEKPLTTETASSPLAADAPTTAGPAVI